LIFRVGSYRFEFRAVGSVYFPPGKAGNVLRGALGVMPDACRPTSVSRPSGLKEPPRPFVLRVAHLDGRRFEPGELFAVDVHVFDLHARLFEMFEEAFANLAVAGLGPGRGAVELLQPGKSGVVEIALAGTTESASRIRVFFRTPTELKGNPARDELPFGVLFARIRDRIATLCSLYGDTPLAIDFAALGDRANQVKTVTCDLEYRDVSRRSSRTGAVHGIGGFIGTMEYEGNVGEFVPYLRAAWWTGVGRHTVWGNGVIEVVAIG
jgi:CRISPR-associated endoribonuclease Cas6